MDLKIKDVADLLNVSESTIRRWIAEGKIPAYLINHQYRFSRTEIENWVMNHKLDKIYSEPSIKERFSTTYPEQQRKRSFAQP
jgi:excisionase family DNA binding protein